MRREKFDPDTKVCKERRAEGKRATKRTNGSMEERALLGRRQVAFEEAIKDTKLKKKQPRWGILRYKFEHFL